MSKDIKTLEKDLEKAWQRVEPSCRALSRTRKTPRRVRLGSWKGASTKTKPCGCWRGRPPRATRPPFCLLELGAATRQVSENSKRAGCVVRRTVADDAIDKMVEDLRNRIIESYQVAAAASDEVTRCSCGVALAWGRWAKASPNGCWPSWTGVLSLLGGTVTGASDMSKSVTLGSFKHKRVVVLSWMGARRRNRRGVPISSRSPLSDAPSKLFGAPLVPRASDW